MKKLILVALLTLTLVGCNKQNTPNYYEQKEALSEPVYGDALTVTHQKVLNEKEILFYAPQFFKIGDKVYTNDYDKDYYIVRYKKDTWSGYTYQYSVASRDLLEKLFGG